MAAAVVDVAVEAGALDAVGVADVDLASDQEERELGAGERAFGFFEGWRAEAVDVNEVAFMAAQFPSRKNYQCVSVVHVNHG